MTIFVTLRLIAVASLSLALAPLGVTTLHAQNAGSVDTRFNPGTGAGDSEDDSNEVYAVAVQPDGKILVGGIFSSFDGLTRSGITRLNADGSQDTTFQPGVGVNANASVRAIALQSDGKILIAGGLASFNGVERHNVARLNGDGSLDLTFNPNDAIRSFLVRAIAVQSDGKVVLGGFVQSDAGGVTSGQVARLNTDGSADVGFHSPTSKNDETGGPPLLTQPIYALTIRPNGKLLFAGYHEGVIGCNSDGTRDEDFQLDPSIGQSPFIYALLTQPDGKILLGGSFSVGEVHTTVSRLAANGEVDPNFTVRPSSGSGNCLALQPDGKILLGGSTRLNPDGSVDPTFVSKGYDAFSLTLQPDGKLVVGGDFKGYVTRLNGDPAPKRVQVVGMYADLKVGLNAARTKHKISGAITLTNNGDKKGKSIIIAAYLSDDATLSADSDFFIGNTAVSILTGGDGSLGKGKTLGPLTLKTKVRMSQVASLTGKYLLLQIDPANAAAEDISTTIVGPLP